MNTERAKNKLLKSGFLPQNQSEDYEVWIDVKLGGTAISFFKSTDDSDVDVFKVHGSLPDRAEFDEFNSFYTENLTQAIRMSRINTKS